MTDTFTFSDYSGRCPFPGCKRPSLCRPHLALIPVDMLDEYDMRRITNYFKIRLRLNDLITANAPGGPRGEAAAPAPPTAGTTRPVTEGTTGPSGRVAALSHKVICAWCKRLMSDGVEPISHGMCPSCEAERMPA